MNNSTFQALYRASSYNGPLATPIAGPVRRRSYNDTPLEEPPTQVSETAGVMCPFIEDAYEGYQNTPPVTPPALTNAGTNPTPTLLGMPVNVRNIIYNYALTYSKPLPLKKRCYYTTWFIQYKPYRALRTFYHFTPDLLRTCTQIAAEATPIFFAANSFQTDIPDGDLIEVVTWLNDTPPAYLRLIESLVLHIEPTTITQVTELAERAKHGADLWQQAGVFSAAISKSEVSPSKVRVHIQASRHMERDAAQWGMKGKVATEVAEEWIRKLWQILRLIEQMEMEVRAEEEAGGLGAGLGELVGEVERLGL